MSIEEKFRGKNPRRVLPQWKQQIAIQRQRMGAYVLAACVSSVIGAAGIFFWSSIPGRLRVFCVVCLVLLPFQVIGYFLDRRILSAYEKAVGELQRRIEETSRD